MIADRLKSSKAIQEIFSNGHSKLVYPLLAKWILSSRIPGANAGFLFTTTVSAKKVKNATNRNLIKRRMREAIRIDLKSRVDILPEDLQIQVIYIFLQSEPPPFQQIIKAVRKLNPHILESAVVKN